MRMEASVQGTGEPRRSVLYRRELSNMTRFKIHTSRKYNCSVNLCADWLCNTPNIVSKTSHRISQILG